MSTTAQPAVAAAPPPSGPRRGGRRGGAGGRGGKAMQSATNAAAALPDDTEEVRKLRARYADKLSLLRELFPDWTDEDLLFALQEAGGEVELAVGRISEGHAEQFSSVKSKKQVKKEAGSTTTPTTFQGTGVPATASVGGGNAPRGGRGGNAAVRGGRGGATRGARGASRGGMRGGASGRGGASVPLEGSQKTIPPAGPTWADTVAATSKTNGTAGGNWGDDVEGLDLKTTSDAAPAMTESTPPVTAVSKAPQDAPAASMEQEAAPSSEEPGIMASTLAKIIPSKLVPKGSKMSWAQIARSNEAAKAQAPESKAAEKVHPAEAAIIEQNAQPEVQAPTTAASSLPAPADESLTSTAPANSLSPQEASIARDDTSAPLASSMPPGLDGISASEDARVASAKPAMGRSAQSQRAVQRAKQQEAVVLANSNAPHDNLGVRFGSLNFLGGDGDDAPSEEVQRGADTLSPSNTETHVDQFTQSVAAPTHVQQHTQTAPTHQDAYTQATSSPFSGKQEVTATHQQGHQQGLAQHQEAHQAAVLQAQQAHQQLQQQQQPHSIQQSEPQAVSQQQQYQQGLATTAAIPSVVYGAGAVAGQTGGQPQQHSIASQYSDYYASLDAQRLSSFYGSYDQQAAAAGATRGGNDDRSGIASQAAPQQALGSNDQQQQQHVSANQAGTAAQQQQQQQHFANVMPYYYPHYYLPNQFQHYGQPGAGYGQYAMYGQQPPQQQQQQQQHPSKPVTPATLQSPYAQSGPADGNGAAGYGNLTSAGHYGQSPAVSSTLAGAGGYNDGNYSRGGNDYSKLYGNSASPASNNAANTVHQQQSNNHSIPGLGGFLGQSANPSNGSGVNQVKNGPSMDHAYRQYDNGKINSSVQQQHHQQNQQVGQSAQQQRQQSQQGGATTPQQQQQHQQQQQYYQQYNAYAAHQQPNAPSGNYQNYQYRQYWG